MDLNPKGWKWAQWLAVISFITFFIVRIRLILILPSDKGVLSGPLNMLFTNIEPKLLSLAIILTMLISFLYTFGLYYDITLEYLLLRILIPFIIIFVEAFILFCISGSLRMDFLWGSLFKELGVFLFYTLSMIICYSKVEFRLQDLAEIERITQSYKQVVNKNSEEVKDQHKKKRRIRYE